MKYKSCVIVGGGVAGVSLSRCLAMAGVQVTLLERSSQLCSGATWHAAGLVTRFAGSSKLKKLHVRSVEIQTTLQEEHGIGFHSPGSIRLIEKHQSDRYLEACQQVAMASLYDDKRYPTRMISPEEIAELHPLVDTSRIECGVHTPYDGDVDPTSLTNCLAKLAKQAGAVFHLKSCVESIAKKSDQFETRYTDRDGKEQVLVSDAVVNAAGLWSMEVSDMVCPDSFDNHPALLIEHQYAISEPIASIQQLDARLPVLRDLAGSAYIRQEGAGLLIGPYETTAQECQFPGHKPTTGAKAPPAGFGMELFADDLDRITDNLMCAIDLVPSLGQVGFASVVNGPTIWTGDSLPRCGRTRIGGYYDFNSLSYGITHGPPLAEHLAAVMLEGEQPFDLTAECDPLRYGNWATPEYVHAKVLDTYAKNNDVAYGSFENRPAGREHLAKHPLYHALANHKAVFEFGAGVESPAFYQCHDSVEYNPCKLHHHDWAHLALAEAHKVLAGVGFSYASFSKIAVTGPRAAEFLDWATTNKLPIKGRTKLTYALTPAGKINAEFTITKMETNDFYLVGSRAYSDHDTQWLVDLAQSGGFSQVQVKDISDEVDVLHLAGPRTPDLMQALCGGQLEGQGFFSMRTVTTTNQTRFNGFKLSFSGEQGYELHVDRADSVALYDEILRAGSQFGLSHFGNYALNSLRIERGYKIKADLDYAHYSEADIGMFLKKEGDFVGRDDGQVPTRSSKSFHVDTEPGWEWSIPGDSPIRDLDGNNVGVITTAAHGARTNKSVALGYLFAGAPHEDLHVESYGRRWPIEIVQQ